MVEPKSAEELKIEKEAATKLERDKIKVTTPEPEKIIETKENDNTETVETVETIEDNKEVIETSEKTEDELKAEQAAATSTKEKERIQKRIDKEVSKRKALETENADLRRQLAAKDGDGEKFTKEDMEKRANELADAEMSQREFANACSKLEKGAVKLDKDFQSKIDLVTENCGKIPVTMITTLDDLDNGSQVLLHFTDNEDEYERIIALPPLKMTQELTKLSLKLAAPKRTISKVPEPHEPTGGTSKITTTLRDDEPMKDWIAKRNAQVAQRQENKRKGLH